MAVGMGTAQVSVPSTAGGTVIRAARSGRRKLILVNHTANACYIGVAGVSSSTGILLPGVVGATLYLNTEAAVYGIAASTTTTVGVLDS